MSVRSEVNLSIDQMLAGSIHRMSHVFRYSSVPTIRKESVSEHSWYVAFYAYLIAKDLMDQDFEIDLGELLSRALVHDLDESMTGDFLRYVKYDHPDLKKALDRVSVKMIDRMGSDLNSSSLAKPWADAKADDIEGHIIQVVDLARVISYVWEEYLTGNRHIVHIIPECSKYIEEFLSKYPASPVAPYASAIVVWARVAYEKRRV